MAITVVSRLGRYFAEALQLTETPQTKSMIYGFNLGEMYRQDLSMAKTDSERQNLWQVLQTKTEESSKEGFIPQYVNRGIDQAFYSQSDFGNHSSLRIFPGF